MRKAGKLGGQETGTQKTEGGRPGGEVAGKVGKKFIAERKSLPCAGSLLVFPPASVGDSEFFDTVV